MKVNITDSSAWKEGVVIVMDQQECKADKDELQYMGVKSAESDFLMTNYMNPATLSIHGWETTSWVFKTLFAGKGWRILQPLENIFRVFYDREIHVQKDKALRRAYLIVDNLNRTAPYATLRFKNYSNPSDLATHLKDVFDSFPNDACRDSINHIQLLEILAERNKTVVVYTHNA